MRQGFLHLKNGREIAVQSFFCNTTIKDILLLWLFLNVQYPIDPAVISLLNVNRQYLLCVLRPEVRYETRTAIGWFKNRTIRKTDAREDDLSRVSVRSTGGHSKRRSGFNQIACFACATQVWPAVNHNTNIITISNVYLITCVNSLNFILSSDDDLCKQFGTRTGWTECPNCLTLIVSLKEFLKKDHFEKVSRWQNMKNYPVFVCLIWFFTSHQQSIS